MGMTRDVKKQCVGGRYLPDHNGLPICNKSIIQIYFVKKWGSENWGSESRNLGGPNSQLHLDTLCCHLKVLSHIDISANAH